MTKPKAELLADSYEFQVWKTDARRDNWHGHFVGSDIRVMLQEIDRLTALVRTAANRPDEAGVREARAEDIAIEICLSYGRDPDEPSDIMEMCDGDNQPVPTWMVYSEQAEAILAKFQVTSHTAPPVDARPSREAIIEECAKVAEAQAQAFLSPQYAANQPFGSICERFACEEVAKAIRSLALPSAQSKSPTPYLCLTCGRPAVGKCEAVALSSTHHSCEGK